MTPSNLFQHDESHFSEATFFDELAEDGYIFLARPRDVPLPSQEDPKEEKSRLEIFVSSSAYTVEE